MTVLSAENVFPKTPFWMTHTPAYLSAGKLLHAITVAELFTALAIANVIDAYPVLMVLYLFPLFTQLDARSRYQEYKQVRDQLSRYGPDRRIFKSVINSRCQRDAALAAARQLGYEATCRTYFISAGYRWYHLMPDFVKDNPRFLFSTAFWRVTFFAPGYSARYPVPDKKESMAHSHCFSPAQAMRPDQR